jgi:glycosyltransferase involved in cell wall biosynthesis
MQKAGKSMRIGIDVRYLSHGIMGGVHTYIRQFVPAVIDAAGRDGDREIFLYADTKRAFELDEQALPAHVTLRKLNYRNPASSVHLDLFMRQKLAEDRIDVAHFPANYGFGPAGSRTVITLHDEINILPLREIWRGHQKSPKTLAMMTYLHAMSSAALRRASVVVTDSDYSGRRIAEVGKIDPARIHVVPPAPTPQFKRIQAPSVLDDVRARHGLPARFALADALKNPAVLVRAWRLLPETLRAGRKIVFFARRLNVLPIVNEAVAAGDAVLLHRPPLEDLVALYSMADVFAFPSWIEGFGIPVLEAMVCGAPVVASDRGSIPEVAGNAALISDAEDAPALAANLSRVLSDENLAATLRARGFARAAQFTWHRTADLLLDAYAVAHAGGARAMPAARAEMP